MVLEDGGDIDSLVELREWNETVLLSEGGNGLWALGDGVGAGESDGGARPLPLPRTLPPPSLRPDILMVSMPCQTLLASLSW
jgi:hypothetical protein